MRKLLLISCLILSSCSTSKFVAGKYKTNIAPFGLSSTEVVFRSDSTCIFRNSRHMQEVFDFNGKYFIKGNKIYIKFDEPNENSQKTSVIDLWTKKDEYKMYALKEEKGIFYHVKYKCKIDKLQVYRVDNGKLVTEVLNYTEAKGRHYESYFLQRVNQE